LTALLSFANVSLELSERFPSDIRCGVLFPDANRLLNEVTPCSVQPVLLRKDVFICRTSTDNRINFYA